MRTFLKLGNLVLGIANLWLAAIDNSVANLIIAALCLYVFYNLQKGK